MSHNDHHILSSELLAKGVTEKDILDAVIVSKHSPRTIHFKNNNRIISFSDGDSLGFVKGSLRMGRMKDEANGSCKLEQERFSFWKPEGNVVLKDYSRDNAQIHSFSHDYDFQRALQLLRNQVTSTYVIDLFLVGNLKKYGIPLTWNVENADKIRLEDFEAQINGENFEFDATLQEIYDQAKSKGVSFIDLMKEKAKEYEESVKE